MSSAISTDGEVRLKPDTTERTKDGRLKPDSTGGRGVRLQADQTLHPWQFFVLAGLGCATAAVFAARGQGITAVVLLSVLMAACVGAGVAALRMLRPLVGADEDRTPMVGHRTRLALEREKMLALRSIKELEFDRAMGKLSDADWREMSGRLRARAARLMRQLDAGAGYREQIEHDLDARLKAPGDEEPVSSSAKASAERSCARCATVNDADARFCKNCGNKL
jgi:hypothetical protein